MNPIKISLELRRKSANISDGGRGQSGRHVFCSQIDLWRSKFHARVEIIIVSGAMLLSLSLPPHRTRADVNERKCKRCSMHCSASCNVVQHITLHAVQFDERLAQTLIPAEPMYFMCVCMCVHFSRMLPSTCS